MPANVTSNSFDSQDVLFASRDAANAWRQSLAVPDATPTSRGVMLVATGAVAGSPTSDAVGQEVVTVNADGTETESLLLTVAEFNAHLIQYNDLVTRYNALIASLQAAGITT